MPRKKRLHVTDDHRKKIQSGVILQRLTAFVEGKIDMTSPQVTAALGLLRKTIPDLQAIAEGVDDKGTLKQQIQFISFINAPAPNSKD
jgi:hypothetical protein